MQSTKHVQDAVAAYVAERGYREGYTSAGFQARQALKDIEELADLQVVLYCAAATLGEILGREVDLAEEALRKARRDVERGVRGGEK